MSGPLYVRWMLSGGRGHKSYSPSRQSAVHIVRGSFPGLTGTHLECGRWTPGADVPALGQPVQVDRDAFRAHPCKDCRIAWTTKVQAPDIDAEARDLLFRFLGLFELSEHRLMVVEADDLAPLVVQGRAWLARAEANYGY